MGGVFAARVLGAGAVLHTHSVWGTIVSDLPGLTELIKQGIRHKGFSFLDVFSPCVTYNHDNTYQWFRPRVKKLEDDRAYNPADWMAAMGKSLLWDEEIPIGKFFERTDVPTPAWSGTSSERRSPRVR
jgi:pyruvate/2-oxoacid:ferredoxin oxidoreductase beta subunit